MQIINSAYATEEQRDRARAVFIALLEGDRDTANNILTGVIGDAEGKALKAFTVAALSLNKRLNVAADALAYLVAAVEPAQEPGELVGAPEEAVAV